MRELRIAVEPIAVQMKTRMPRSWVCSKETIVARIAGLGPQIAGEQRVAVVIPTLNEAASTARSSQHCPDISLTKSSWPTVAPPTVRPK